VARERRIEVAQRRIRCRFRVGRRHHRRVDDAAPPASSPVAGVGEFVLRSVTLRRGGSTLLDAIDLTISAQGITVLTGPSGSGKTTLLRQLNRLDVADSGTISWQGHDLATLDVHRLRRTVGFVFQRPVVFDGTVMDNLATASPDLTPDRADALLTAVGLGGFRNRVAAELSGGEAQRLCLARALTTDPEMILADEPTASLDEDAAATLETLAIDLADGSWGRPIGWVWVSHSVAQIRRIADHVVVMDQGAVVAEGTIEQLAGHADERVRRLANGTT